MKMWYKQPASTWTESLPLGNGRMGAMIYGGIKEELLSLNEDSLWSGYPKDKTVEEPYEHWENARKLVRKNQFSQADAYIEDHLLGEYTEAYLPFGDLKLTFPDIDDTKIMNYERSLDLSTAISHVNFTSEGVTYQRESFVSAVDQVLITRLTADREKTITVDVTMSSKLCYLIKTTESILSMSGIAPSIAAPSYFPCEEPIVYEVDDAKKGMTFGAVLEVALTDGTMESYEDHLLIKDASEVILKLFMRTSYNGFDKHPYLEGKSVELGLETDRMNLQGKSYDAIKNDHIREHRSYFDRVKLSFGEPEQDIPTDQRLIAFQTNQNDPYLYSLLFNYGRYLLISSSRPGTLPANLQGIWNDELRAPFSCNYTTNINLQMNYWPAESSNLSELHEPLFDFIKVLSVSGKKTASLYYHSEGAVVHHNSDIWGLSTPVGRDLRGMSGCGSWNGGFGWLTQHLMTHYEYSLDLDFLKETAYPAIKLAAEFFMTILEENEEGYYWAISTTSPENTFMLEGETCHQSKFATMTNGIIREVFKNSITCTELLDCDHGFAVKVKSYLDRLYPYKISEKGYLQEWEADYEEHEPHHRHISHLYGLYPGEEIHPQKTPELAMACEQTLINRTDVGTGWSLGWKIITWARLQDGDHALKLLKKQLKLSNETKVILAEGEGSGSYLNLFDAHPPFQIDGNFAAVSGVIEMLMQSYDKTIHLLPALSKELPYGSVQGLRAKQGIEVNISFADGELVEARLMSLVPQSREIFVVYNGVQLQRTIKDQQIIRLTQEDFIKLSFL